MRKHLLGSLSACIGFVIAVAIATLVAQFAIRDAQLARAHRITQFICDDMRYDDAWRKALHEAEVRYHPPRRNDPLAVLRDRAFTAREIRSRIREVVCDDLEHSR